MVGGAPLTRGVEGKKTRDQRGKDGVGIVHHKRCKYCTQHGKSLEEASICPGRGPRSLCTGGESGIPLECMICNSITPNAGVQCLRKPPLLSEAADGRIAVSRNVFIECMGTEVGLN